MARLGIHSQRTFLPWPRCRACAALLILGCSSGEVELASRRPRAPEGTEEVMDLVGEASSPDPLGPAAEFAPVDTHALLGLNPAHGPYRGGGLTVLRGNGFSSELRVWFGATEVPREQILATRADRVQVTVPAGTPGAVAVTTQNGADEATRRVLESAYLYDAFYAAPERGPTAGGMVITLFGSGTSWSTETRVQLDAGDCEVIALRGEAGAQQELDCRTPPGSDGQKTISVITGARAETLLGGFTYEPGALLAGGFGGEPIGSDLSVYVTTPAGTPLAGAYVILGASYDLERLGEPGSAIRETDVNGEALFRGDVTGPTTVTIAARCYHPLSFVDVPVDTLRAELSPVASPDCVDAQPPSFGGSPVRPVILSGELIWPGAIEFRRAGWTNVPREQQADERRAAYVLQPSTDPGGRFRLPRAESAVTLGSPGQAGYEFQVTTGSGSRTLYAVAGIENRTVDPPRFTAYALGVLRGIYADPGEVIQGLAIPMTLTLDQALPLELEAPAPGGRGPDRLQVSAAVQISEQGFFLLPNLERQAPLPGGGAFELIGLPALVDELTGAQYALSVRAVTGEAGGLPQSILPLLSARDASRAIPVRSFVPVPTLSVAVTERGSWDHALSTSWTDRGRSVDLIHYAISSGSGLITWSVAAPPSAQAVELPDLSPLPAGDLLPGELDVVVSLASLPDLDYAQLEQRQLRRPAWEAYAIELASSRYERP